MTYYTYDTAPDSPALRGSGLTRRQLQRAVQAGKLTCIRTGSRVLFTEEMLQDWLDRSTVKAVN